MADAARDGCSPAQTSDGEAFRLHRSAHPRPFDFSQVTPTGLETPLVFPLLSPSNFVYGSFCGLPIGVLQSLTVVGGHEGHC
jgi:hypothetical protein